MTGVRAVRVESPVAPERLARWLLHTESQAAEVAAVLHGELGGLLTVAGMHLQRPRLSAAIRSTLQQTLRRAAEVNREAAARLHPPLLQHLGPGAALQVLADAQCRRHGVQAVVSLDGHLPVPAFATAMALLRCGEQAVDNVLVHAGAKRVDLRLQVRDGQWRLSVADAGAGCDPTQAVAVGGSLCLLGAWFSALGGGLQLRAAPAAGCVVDAWLPLQLRAVADGAVRS